MINIPLWEKLFGLKSRKGNEPISQGHKNLAAAIQKVTEDLFLLLARHAKKLLIAKISAFLEAAH